ncbi:MAG: Hpt domain-containing protein, partial [Prochlorothrix sp.]
MVMWIDDDELRDLFKTSSEERLQNIDAGLLHLEKHPDDAAVIDAIMRDAHSLKGDSNMLGLKDIGTIAHEVEHIFKAVQQGDQVLTVELCDRLAHTLADLGKMVQEAVTGEACGISAFYVLAQLMGGSGPPPPKAATPPGLATPPAVSASETSRTEVSAPTIPVAEASAPETGAPALSVTDAGLGEAVTAGNPAAGNLAAGNPAAGNLAAGNSTAIESSPLATSPANPPANAPANGHRDQ